MAWISLEVVVAVGFAGLLTNVASNQLPGWLSNPWVVFPGLAVVLAGVIALTARRHDASGPGRPAIEPAARPSLDPPRRPLPARPPEVWLLQPRYSVVPYLGRKDLLDDLQAWCTEGRPFSIGLITGEGGSGKSRLAAELCGRMQTHAWDAGFISSIEALTEFDPKSPTLLVVDYPENWLTVLGATLERLANRVAAPPVRVLLLARKAAARSPWWADLDRTSHRTASLYTGLRRDLAEYPLSLSERQHHAQVAVQAFGRFLGVEAAAVPDVANEEFANPLLVHIAALLAVQGHHAEPNSPSSVREDVLAHLLDREQSRWARLQVTHQLADLHETHALRAVLAAVLCAPKAGEAAALLAALPEFAGAAQNERRGRIAYWLADLYPGELLLESFGPDLLIEELLDSAARGSADLQEVVAAVHLGTTSSRHRGRMLTTLRLAADRPAVYSVLHRYLAESLAALVTQALDDADGALANVLDNVLTYCGERGDPELKLALECGQLQIDAPAVHERGAQLLCTTMQLAIPLFRGMAKIDPVEGLEVFHVGLSQLIHRYGQAGRREEALAASVECVEVSRQLVNHNRDRYLADLSFDLGNLAAAHAELGQHGEALSAAGEGVALQRQLAREGKGDESKLAMALYRLSGTQAEMQRFDEALAANSEAVSSLRVLAGQNRSYYLPVLAKALSIRGAILTGQHRLDEALVAVTEAIALCEDLVGEQPEDHLSSLQYDLGVASRVNAELGRYDEALAVAERAVAVSRRLTAANPRRHRIVLIKNLGGLARAHLGLARPDDAVAAVEDAVTLGHQGTEGDLLAALGQLVNVLVELDRHLDALPFCETMASLLRRLSESQPRFLGTFVSTLIDLSQILGSLDRPDEALTMAQEAVETGRGLDASEGSKLARALIELGDRYSRLRRLPEALTCFAEGAKLLRAADQTALLALALAKLADHHARLGHQDEALAAGIEAVQMGEVALKASRAPRHCADFAYALEVVGNIHLSFGRAEDGVGPFMLAVELHEELAKFDSGRYLHGLAATLHGLANAQVAAGRNEEAVESCLRGNRLYEQLTDADEDHYLFQFAGSLKALRDTHVTAGQFEEAVSLAHRLVEVLPRLVAKDPGFHGILVESCRELVYLLSMLGQFAEARRISTLADTYEEAAQAEPPSG
ncbi:MULTISPECIES: tetratricopeptide repeat protein [Amycolatopsis]|uniref:Anaphase-promoting complex subunit 5 domain-containing protein n=1 Tax=Amycolatopsis bullii TaxID=941987 RepID=A0ABQ3K5J4_9PSEU|nr:tetratricopeptide repeat protein [Amycolatopsis bullii]GHG03843.1 hypothetical protein GCM10017567_19720 [Amycolatopsis bullii]